MIKLPLLIYLACLPLFFSASAMSWPFPESTESTPSQSRDCLIATAATDTQEKKKAVEDEEPDCE